MSLWSAVRLLLVAIGLGAACTPTVSRAPSAGPALVRHRAYYIGDSTALREFPEAASALQPLKQIFDQPSVVTKDEESAVPTACGEEIAAVYERAVADHFRAIPLRACSLQHSAGQCPTSYLAGYPRMFMRLDYEYGARHFWLKLDVVLARSDGAEEMQSASLKAPDAGWFQGLWEHLVAAAHCGHT